MKRSGWISISGAGAIVVALSAGSCSSGSSGTSATSGNDAGADATTTTTCTTDAQCAATVPTTIPANCATGTCNAVQGLCVYAAKDEDGDGHAAADCKSTSGVMVSPGDDCNDHDSNLYPGHPESCSTAEDGGPPPTGFCAAGAITCKSDGTQSGCEGTVVCVNQTCASSKCIGNCAQGQTECSSGNTGVETCNAQGAFGNVTACVNQTCVGGTTSAGGVTGPATCTGVCAPGQLYCMGAQPQSCGPGGQWANMGTACSGSTPACDNSNGTCGTCAPTTLRCNLLQPQQCGTGSAGWQNVGAACANACLNGACVACNPGSTTCSGNGVETCDATGNWGAPAACSASQTCVQSGVGTASCTGVCGPGQQECNGNDVWQCNASGAYAAMTTCTNQTCVQTGTTAACAGVCSPTQTECLGNTPQTCSGSGQWQAGTACSGANPFCVSGACVASYPSCAPGGAGMTNCGGGSASCCASLEVTGGTYSRTYTNSGSGPTATADSASVSNFRLDEYEVTVGRFRQFVTAWNGGSGWLPPQGSGKHTHLNGGQGLANSGSPGTYEPGWDATDWNNTTDVDPTNANLASCSPYSTWTNTASSQENLPINCVNWWESAAFCIWDGGFLPSEAEWEYAAAGGSLEKEYPWGSTAPGTACPGTGCQYAIYNCDYPSGSGSCTGVTNIAPVGTATLGAGVWGQLDLAGNVWEWNLDWYATYVSPCTDCAYLTAASFRVLRGGFFYDPTSYLLPPYRYGNTPTDRINYIGFRCARTP